MIRTREAPPRSQVPSEREARLGLDVPELAVAEAAPVPVMSDDEAIARPPFRLRMREYLRQLNPWTVVAGYSAFPIILFGLMSATDQLFNGANSDFFPFYRNVMGTNIGLIGLSAGIPVLTNILLGPYLGFLADRFPRLLFVRAGTVLEHGCALLMGLSGLPITFVLFQSTRGVGQSVYQVGTAPLTADYYPLEVRIKAGFFSSMVGQLATIVSFPLAGALAIWAGWRWAIIFIGLAGLCLSLAAWRLREPVRGQMDRQAAGVDPALARLAPPPLSWRESWRAAYSIRTLRSVWLAFPFLIGASLGTSLILLQYFYYRWQLGPVDRGLVGSVIAIGGFVSLLVIGPTMNRLMVQRPARALSLIGVVFIASGIVPLLIFLAPTLWMQIALTPLIGAVGGLVIPMIGGLFAFVVPARIRAFAMQTIQPFAIGFIALAIPILVLVPQLPGGYSDMVLALIPLALIGGALMLRTARFVDRDARSMLAVTAAEQESMQAKARGTAKMLVVRDLDVHYDAAQVIFGLNLDIEDGEILALLGTNGAGKSTLLRAISGLTPPSTGAIFLDGDDITHSTAHRSAARGVVLMPGGHAVFPRLTVAENLRAAAWTLRDDVQEVATRTEEMLHHFPILRERLHMMAGDLSGGEQQMVALSQAFLMRPRLLMIDELSLGLAPLVVEQLLGMVRRIHEQGTTILLVEQSVNVALTIAERAIFMEKGEIRYDGPTASLLSHPELVRSVFLGQARGAGSISAGPARVERRWAEDDREQVLGVEGVGVTFGGVRALHGVDISIAAGEIVGMIGPNGAGKTTLIDVISGFVQPDHGVIVVAGNDVTKLSPDERARRGLARSFQNVRLFPGLTVRENIAVAMERHVRSRNPFSAALWLPDHRRSEARVQRRIDGLIQSLGLAALADKFMTELSTGSRRVVDIACVLAASPRLLLLDEPSSGLAQSETEELGPFLARVVKETGCAVLMVEHDLPLAASVSHRLVAMRLGEIVAAGLPREVLADPEVVSSYTGAATEVIARSGAAGRSLQELSNPN